MRAPHSPDLAAAADARLRAFLAETLEVWGMSGRVEPLPAPGVARIACAGKVLLVERACDLPGFRWLVRIPSADAATVQRPCASLPGVLGALRRALGMRAGSPIRIARDPA